MSGSSQVRWRTGEQPQQQRDNVRSVQYVPVGVWIVLTLGITSFCAQLLQLFLHIENTYLVLQLVILVSMIPSAIISVSLMIIAMSHPREARSVIEYTLTEEQYEFQRVRPTQEQRYIQEPDEDDIVQGRGSYEDYDDGYVPPQRNQRVRRQSAMQAKAFASEGQIEAEVVYMEEE